MEYQMSVMILIALSDMSVFCFGKYFKGNDSCTDSTFSTDIDASETNVHIVFCPLHEIRAGAFDHLTSLETFGMTRMATL